LTQVPAAGRLALERPWQGHFRRRGRGARTRALTTSRARWRARRSPGAPRSVVPPRWSVRSRSAPHCSPGRARHSGPRRRSASRATCAARASAAPRASTASLPSQRAPIPTPNPAARA